MKYIYYLIVAILAFGIGYSVACLTINRPECFGTDVLIKNYSGDYTCVNRDYFDTSQ